MDRHTLLEWMDSVAPLWTGENYQDQMFIDRWWWELFEAMKQELMAYCPMMVYKITKGKS